jgi:hypothetical protein
VPTSGLPPDLALAIERASYEVLGQKLDLLKLDQRRRFARKPCPDYRSLSLVHRCRSGFDGSRRASLAPVGTNMEPACVPLRSSFCELDLASDVSSLIRTS